MYSAFCFCFCVCICLEQSDLKGTLPQAVIKFATNAQAESVSQLRSEMEADEKRGLIYQSTQNPVRSVRYEGNVDIGKWIVSGNKVTMQNVLFCFVLFYCVLCSS